MDISFILSTDEVFTLISMIDDKTEAGELFSSEALPGAGYCDLSGLVDKKLARVAGDELELAPVLRMLADAIARASSIERSGEAWSIRSPWVSLRCEEYPYREGHLKITPVKEEPTP